MSPPPTPRRCRGSGTGRSRRCTGCVFAWLLLGEDAWNIADFGSERRYAEWYPEFREAPPSGAAQLKQIPLGRQGRPADIANACVFLASDESASVTGDTMRVMGGRLIG
ncbi:MAG TPA: SDR family oxidoreductase [Candidatus Limnocylindrales bacterium]|nr:SDR family oxidoreductase [Candidatus Limnocylindrales bacterium]